MKKLLLAYVMLLSLSANAQKIRVDRIGSDGRHEVRTIAKDFRIDNFKYDMTLKIYESADSIEWRLMIGSFNTITNDNIVLLKLKNGQVIKLAADSLYEESYTHNSVVYKYNFVNTVRHGQTTTYYVSESRIKVEDLDRIEAYGISKIRIGNSNKYIEKEWPDNLLGKYLIKCRKKIAEHLNQNADKKKKGSIYDGF